MRISDWSSDVCSSDLNGPHGSRVASTAGFLVEAHPDYGALFGPVQWRLRGMASEPALQGRGVGGRVLDFGIAEIARRLAARGQRSEEHTSEPQSLMRHPSAVFCLKQKKHT